MKQLPFSVFICLSLFLTQGATASPHTLTKRASLDLKLRCLPQWNDTTNTYTVHVQWIVSNIQLIGNVNYFFVDYHEKYNTTGNNVVAGSHEELPIQHAINGQTLYALTDSNRSPLDATKLATYEISTSWRVQSSDSGYAFQTISLTPPSPPTPNNITLVSHHFQLYHIAQQGFVVIFTHISLLWTINETQGVNTATLSYYVCIGPSINPSALCFIMQNVTHISNSLTLNGLLIHLTPLVISSLSQFVYLKIHSLYTVNTGSGDNITVNSTWSQLLHLSLIETSSTLSSPTTSSSVSRTLFIIPTTSNHGASPLFTIEPPSSPTPSSLVYYSSLLPLATSSIPFPSSQLLLSDTPMPSLITTPSVFHNAYIIPLSLLCIVILLVFLVVVVAGLCILKVNGNRRKFKDISNRLDNDGSDDVIAIFKTNSIMITGLSEPVLDEWEIPIEAIEFDQLLGEGCFGEVYLGSLSEEYISQALTSFFRQTDSRGFVAIKLLKPTASSSEKNDFLKEIELMKKISRGKNQRVINMIGSVTIQEPMILITEFMMHGDLLSYLRACRKKMVFHRGKYTHNDDDNDDTEALGAIDAGDLVSFAYQITSGMEYLASLQVVHRDLACRNILVGEGKSLKITDFGMSRMIYNDSAYVKTTKGKLPLKWMSIESIVDRIFTTSSDVWSFGICLWEIATLGHTPYPTIGNEDLLPMLMQGHRMDKPVTCSDEIYDIMLMCWQVNEDDRPSFIALRYQFDRILSKQRSFNEHYIDLSNPVAMETDEKETKLSQSNDSIVIASNNCSSANPLELSHLSNLYVDSPTHSSDIKDRPMRLSLQVQQFIPIEGITPGGISLPADAHNWS